MRQLYKLPTFRVKAKHYIIASLVGLGMAFAAVATPEEVSAGCKRPEEDNKVREN